MQRMTVSAGIRRSPIRTPAMRGADSSPFTSASPVTSPVWLRTPAARQVRTSASAMSPARSDTGKTRLPRSTFNAMPHPSKKVRVSCVSKPDRALYRKRGFVSTCRRNSSRSQSLVTLHRPFPVMRSLRQGRSPRSRRSTPPSGSPAVCKVWAAAIAAIMPAAPAPTTSTRGRSVIL